MKKKVKLWCGLSAVSIALLVLMATATDYAFGYADVINSRLGLETAVIETPENANEDTTYYKSEFGEINATNQEKLIAATKEQSVNEMREGAVLLRNERETLPLKSEERRVTMFGHASIDPVYRGNSAGNMPEEPNMTTLRQAMEGAGFEINPTLWEAYQNSGVTRVCSDSSEEVDLGEDPIEFYTDTIRQSWANDYNDVAFIVLSRESAEGIDFFMKDGEGISQLALHKNERDMIEMVTQSGKFGKVVVLLNTPTPIELDWLEEYDIDACLWIGYPGQWGAQGVADILTGAVNPTGRTVDTYAADSLSSPAVVNSGTNTPRFSNGDEVANALGTRYFTGDYATVQVEGIYVGYRYYETRYEDAILGKGNATSSAGASFGTSWNYADEVTYPFGYGLSYTTYTYDLKNVVENDDGTMSVTVTVTNTGEVAGKTAVEIYAQTPYGDYERENKVEKSAIQLVAFDKTDVIEPQAAVDITIPVDKYLLASYDYTNAKGYILSEGDYYLAVGEDAHDALNNVLSAKNASGLVDAFGNAVEGDSGNVFSWHEDFDDETYATSAETGKEITNLFDECDINYFAEGTATYLSRSDWDATYPKTQTVPTATDEMIDLLKGDTYSQPADGIAARDIAQGDRSKDIKFLEMRDVEWDDPKWEDYLSQMSIEELASQISDSYGTPALVSIVKPETKTGDGIDGVGGRLPFGERPNACCYTGKVISDTWSPDLMTRRGELMGEESLYCGYTMVYSTGANLHRTPFGGRNFEYISEDGNFAYYAAYYEVTGMKSKGVNAAVKHFAANDQEFKRMGVATFFNEQAMRETTLRPFEGGIRKGKTHAFMQSYNRVGCTWSSANYALCTSLVREEWGFEGAEITDAASTIDYAGRFQASITAGTDIYCIDSKGESGKQLVEAISENDDGTLLLALRRAVKANHFSAVNSCAINGLSIHSTVREIMPTWQYLAIAGIILFAVATATFFTLFVLSKHFWTSKEDREKEVTE